MKVTERLIELLTEIPMVRYLDLGWAINLGSGSGLPKVISILKGLG